MEEPRQIREMSEQAQIRRAKLQKLIDAGANPYEQVRFGLTHGTQDIAAHQEELMGQAVAIAGRMITRRIMGKASFAHILDGQGKMQIYVQREALGEEAYARFKESDLGDIFGITGKVFLTQKGELSIHVETIILLSKALLPLPEKFHGLTDIDARYRQRYLDLIVNPDVREVFVKRSKTLQSIRHFLDERGYLEVDTPVLQTHEVGANARPFYTHHNTLDMPLTLRIEMELHLKRLIVGGFERVYEVGRIFRNEGMDPTHNPEYTMVELYQAYADFHDMMDLVEDLFGYVTQQVCGTMDIIYQGKEISMKKGWPRMSMASAVKQYSGVDYFSWTSDEEARSAASEKGVFVEKDATKGIVLDKLFEAFVEDKLVNPTFIYDYPVDISPLAKRRADNPEFTDRFEFFINCVEGGNAFSELNDPIDQKGRFEKQIAEKIARGEKAQLDEDYINALEIGLPPTGGLGFGVDRLVMLLTDSPSIRDVLLFPTMKPRG